MTHSDMYPFPDSPLLSSPSSTITSTRRVRSRVLSLLSLDASTGPIRPESPKAEPTTWTSASFQNHFACGSFVPNTSATVALRTFLFPTVTHVRVRGRMRYNSHFEKKPDLPPSPSSPIPVITRALPLSSGSRSPSSNITSPTIPKYLLALNDDLNSASRKTFVQRVSE
ncbi:hypothetical protein Ac2012v2_005554 [Leucoagaricus gongylophorus]